MLVGRAGRQMNVSIFLRNIIDLKNANSLVSLVNCEIMPAFPFLGLLAEKHTMLHCVTCLNDTHRTSCSQSGMHGREEVLLYTLPCAKLARQVLSVRQLAGRRRKNPFATIWRERFLLIQGSRELTTGPVCVVRGQFCVCHLGSIRNPHCELQRLISCPRQSGS